MVGLSPQQTHDIKVSYLSLSFQEWAQKIPSMTHFINTTHKADNLPAISRLSLCF